MGGTGRQEDLDVLVTLEALPHVLQLAGGIHLVQVRVDTAKCVRLLAGTSHAVK